MQKLMFVFFIVAVQTAGATCADFSGIFFDEDGGSCLVTQQTGCERSLQTSHFRTARPLTIDYITDGVLRRYPVERSMRKAVSYDEQGRQIFLGIDDNNGRIDGLYTKLADGRIHLDLTWTDISGEASQFESVLIPMSTLAECKQRL